MKLFLLCFLALVLLSTETVTARNYCGSKVFKKIFEVCPGGCTVEDYLLPTKMCSYKLPDSIIKDACCPDQ